METIFFQKNKYKVGFMPSGQVAFLYDDRKDSANWVAAQKNCKFGVPFMGGTQDKEDAVPCTVQEQSENSISFSSFSGATKLEWGLGEECLALNYRCMPDCGPRMGLELDLNLLDLGTGTPWTAQCMPTTIYTDPNCGYAYFIFTTSDGRYLSLCIDGSFAAWRIKYSYQGHRMTGFQVLSQADDVICGDRKPLPVVDRLTLVFGFPNTLEEAFRQISGTLGICIARPELSGGFPGSEIPLALYGESVKTQLLGPDQATLSRLCLGKPGEYQIRTAAKNGRIHTASVLCQEDWEPLFDRVNGFYAKYFQHDCGAFSRVIWKDTLSPKNGVTFEGVAFGDPEQLMSCRTGEFGGFSAWAMLKNCLLFGEKPELMNSIDRYINGWVMNRQGGRPAYNGAICTAPMEFLGRSYSAYHLYHEVNYPQHELFLMEQFADAYRLTGDRRLVEDLKNLTLHFISDHMTEDGCILCQNGPYSTPVDYCTVHPGLASLLRALEVLEQEGLTEAAETVEQMSRKLADYVCVRGLGFPTEGEPCTEDGSMACTVISLLMAYEALGQESRYLEQAKSILDAHKMLELVSADCRMNGSSIRFWETQYESRDWGPSINAGHGWTIWTAEAKARMAVITQDFSLLCGSYNGFVTNLRKIEKSGGMPCCYTPDMIPGTPHAHGLYGNTEAGKGVCEDMRPTSTHLGMRYVEKTYSVSGNYALVKAGELFGHISGVSPEKGVCVNGILSQGTFHSKAPHFDTLVVEPFASGSLRIANASALKICCTLPLQVELGRLLSQNNGDLMVEPEDGTILLRPLY